jgi:hypothetical protein
MIRHTIQKWFKSPQISYFRIVFEAPTVAKSFSAFADLLWQRFSGVSFLCEI